MLKKDYILIARAIHAARIDVGDAPRSRTPESTLAWNDALDRVATYLREDLARGNPKFDARRFLDACGVQS